MLFCSRTAGHGTCGGELKEAGVRTLGEWPVSGRTNGQLPLSSWDVDSRSWTIDKWRRSSWCLVHDSDTACSFCIKSVRTQTTNTSRLACPHRFNHDLSYRMRSKPMPAIILSLVVRAYNSHFTLVSHPILSIQHAVVVPASPFGGFILLNLCLRAKANKPFLLQENLKRKFVQPQVLLLFWIHSLPAITRQLHSMCAPGVSLPSSWGYTTRTLLSALLRRGTCAHKF